MSRVFAIAVALSAILFVAFGFPNPQEVQTQRRVIVYPRREQDKGPLMFISNTKEGGEGGAEEQPSTTAGPNPACAQYNQQCSGGQGGMAPIQSGAGAIPGMGGMVNNTDFCKQLAEQCNNNGAAPTGAPITGAPGAQPPAMNGSMPNPPEMGGIVGNLTQTGMPGGMPLPTAQPQPPAMNGSMPNPPEMGGISMNTGMPGGMPTAMPIQFPGRR